MAQLHWGYNPLTNHLLTFWDIQVCIVSVDLKFCPKWLGIVVTLPETNSSTLKMMLSYRNRIFLFQGSIFKYCKDVEFMVDFDSQNKVVLQKTTTIATQK